MRTLAMVILATSLTACEHPTGADRTTEEARGLLAAGRDFAALSAKRNPKTAFAAYMAPDGIMLPAASAGAIEGYDKVLASFGADGDPGYRLLWQPQFAEVARSGDMGWTWGHYQLLVDDKEIRTGKYVNVWKRQPDGSWKVRVDIGNQRPAK